MVVADRARYDLDLVAKERLASLHTDEALYQGVLKTYEAKKAGAKARPLSEVVASLDQ